MYLDRAVLMGDTQRGNVEKYRNLSVAAVTLNEEVTLKKHETDRDGPVRFSYRCNEQSRPCRFTVPAISFQISSGARRRFFPVC